MMVAEESVVAMFQSLVEVDYDGAISNAAFSFSIFNSPS
jgi:hypothetical protein